MAKSSIKTPCEDVVIGASGWKDGRRSAVLRRQSSRKDVVGASSHSCSVESTVIALPDGSTMTVIGFIDRYNFIL
jgi:hypothetical protein